ncbi:MAG: hypothetical protein IJP31_01040 [Lachnospiraceae bacterium]|nr:hypothetical protein [Lachnospiraceae bacterium]
MQKKTIILLLLLITTAISIAGCGRKKEGLYLVFYQEQNEVFYPYQREWIYGQGTLSATDAPLRITMLPLSYQPDLLYEGQWFASSPSPRTGRDIFIRAGETLHDFHIQTTDGQFTDISLIRPGKVSVDEWEKTRLLKADYDQKTKNLTLILGIDGFLEQKQPLLLIGNTSVSSPDKITWEKIEIEAEEYFHLQYEDYLILTDGWLYGTSTDFPVRISLKTGQPEELDKLQATVFSLLPKDALEAENDYSKRLFPVGRYGDMVIWEWPGSGEFSGFYFLFDEQNLIGSIAMQADGKWNIRDAKGNSSIVDMSAVYQNTLYFPQ